ncbi:MAG: hypothetical protein LC687_05445 [Actinobacteria bacterium]|nr:hypothetical protein [Actinomycetota bacterium]MCA1807275.1 hypothetical protein [Actinomycetota bacterium]
MHAKAIFDVDIEEIMDNIDSRVGKETAALSEVVWEAAVDYSPVWTGAYQASWLISFGSPEFMFASEYKIAGTGPTPQRPYFAFGRDDYEVAYVTNGAPYAEFVEFGGPHNQAHYVATRAAKVIYT